MAQRKSDLTQQLFVEFEVEPPAKSGCPLTRFDGDIVDVRQQRTGTRCQMDVTRQSDDCRCVDDARTEIVHVEGNIEHACPCTVFGEHDCVPHITELSEGSVIVETYLPDRERLPDLVSDLKAVVDAISLRRLTRVESRDHEDRHTVVSLDLYELTEKQREAARAAVVSGYYSRPRETKLGELATELGLSKSALSQRLSAVESNLAINAFATLTSD